MYPAAIHSLAHRAPHKAPPATRTRVRWQPYNSTTTPCLNTPSSSTPSSSPTLSCAQQPPSSSSSSKSKYASSLVDQAVKSLSEIWQPQDIPIVFLTSSRASVPGSADSHIPTPPPRRTSTLNQLPSPVSPSTPSCPSQASLDPTGAASLPIKPFVHEVLRRSRTSGTVLQTALCYLEAIRPKIPSLVQKDKAGIPTSKEPELASRITIATEAELSDGIDQSIEQQGMDTVKVFDAGECPYDSGADSGYGSGSICGSESGSILPTPAADLTPLPPLPSPLLCPRRAFLASLILASKFTQDKTYSNRAWAKLSGLPPREIGRCERALGEELGWRLWVGKTPCASSSPEKVVEETPAAGKTRPVARCQSETNLRSTSSAGAFLAPAPSAPVKPLLNRSGSGLRRSSTLPAEAFTQKQQQPIHRKSHLNNVVTQWIHNSSREDSDTQMYSPTVSIEECCNSVNSGFGDETPYPPTPALSYSPSSSSGSSGGDRTIQMSTFLDDLSLNANNNNSWTNSIFGVACPGNENQHGFCSLESKAKNDVFSTDVWGVGAGVNGGIGMGVRMVGVGTIV